MDIHKLGLFGKEVYAKEMNKAGFITDLIDDPFLEKIEQKGTYMLAGHLPPDS